VSVSANGTGRIEAIYLWPKSRGEPRVVTQAVARPGGLAGDRKRSKKRQVTVLAAEAWAAATAAVGSSAPASARRANLVISGVDLARALGRRVRIGPIVLSIRGETMPCYRMDEVHDGLKDALGPDVRAGVFGAVEGEGVLRIGDPVEILP
jgi:MOSC domain-containing protein YiiM